MKSTTFYIYHIPGRKYGCTQNYPARPASQSDIYELTEVHTDIMVASEREKELNVDAGYPWSDGQYYWRQVNNGKISGIKNTENGHLNRIRTYEGCARGGKSSIGKNNYIAKSIVRICYYCNKTIKGPNYFKWHGDKCKQKNK